MRPHKITSLYICHWSLNDPLCQSQALAYLRKLASRGYRFALMTFEQSPYRMDQADSGRVRRSLAKEGIYWYPITYHRRPPLLSKAYDCCRAILTALTVMRRHSPSVVHTRGTSSVAIALTLQLFTRVKFLYDADSSLAEEYADTGYWSRTGIAFRVTDAFERLARSRADAIIVLTERMRRRFIDHHRVVVPIEVIPCCVATDRLRFDSDARQRLRRELGIRSTDPLLIYVGKTGWRYETDAMFAFVGAVRARINGVKLLVLTPDAPSLFQSLAAEHRTPGTDCWIKMCSPADVPGWLSAADAGLAFIRPLPCETGSAPVKVGEYLAVGLPVVMTPEIGDYSRLVEAEHLGVVVESLDAAGLARGAADLENLMKVPEPVRHRCRSAAEVHLSVDTVGAPRYAAMYELLGCPTLPAAAIPQRQF